VAKIIIIGGGIIGSMIGYFLKANGYAGQVMIVEPDPSYKTSSTARSASAIRQQFNLGINAAMSHYSFGFLQNVHEHLCVNGESPDIGFVERGYLVLATPEGAPRLREAHARQVANGADILFLEPSDLERRLPWLKLDEIGAACLGQSGEGWFDPNALLAATRRRAEHLGVQYVAARVTSLQVRGNRIREVELDDRSKLGADVVINAAGARAAAVARLAGLALPLESRKRTAFVFAPLERPLEMTNIVDPTFGSRGVYARPSHDHVLAVTSPAPEHDPDTEDLGPDTSLFEEIIVPALSRRVRGFETMQLVQAWAGHYEMNTFDQNALLGPHPDLSNFVLACGLSGHGIMHAPAIGRGLAEWLMTGAYHTLDLTPFSLERVIKKLPLDDVQASEHRKISAGV
jgi:FAD-dependent oxidoreductase domain-containing protein 1